ncbi:MAG: hypothetical protein FK733_09345 [Asgard group archaeon]|nr:hypothetical protein [Asgard group archaeon]
MTKKLLEFFKVKYKGAANFRINNVKCELEQGDIEIYSFNLKCQYKREPYNLNYFIKFYKRSQAIIKGQSDPSKWKDRNSGDPFIRFVGDDEFFGFPFQIIDKDEKSILKDIKD